MLGARLLTRVQPGKLGARVAHSRPSERGSVVFMGIVLAVCIFTYILQRGHLQSEHHMESLVSRESSFLFNEILCC